jgi:enoyl-CoA hydratase/carnithine racemase
VIRSALDGRLLTVTLDREAKANALTADMLSAIAEVAAGAGDAQALILTGVGTVFSAGADLTEVRDHALSTSPVWTRASEAIAAFPGLSIAALNGTLAGGAFALALACDLRIAVPGASFFYPVMRLGHRPQPQDPARLAALIGPARAKLILMGGARLTADQALAFGLIDAVVPGSELLPFARALAQDALAADPAHVTAIKRMVPGSKS